MNTLIGKKEHGRTAFMSVLLFSLLLLAGCGSFKYPFEEDFEKGGKTFDVSPGSTWGVAASHEGWETFRGVYHLDNNVKGAGQGPTSNVVKETPQAGMHQPIRIPKTAKTPILSFWVKCNLQAGDEIYVDLGFVKKKNQKSSKWIIWNNTKYDVEVLKTFTAADNTGEFHKWVKISLDAYKDQDVLVWFRENMAQSGPGRVFAVDDFRISDLPTQDTDGDSIPDPFDPTPKGEKLPALMGFKGTLNNLQSVELEWGILKDQPLLSGYRLYRKKQGENSEILLNNGLLIAKDRNTFSDAGITIGQTYSYRIVAVSKEGQEGLSGDPVVIEVEDQKGEFPFEEDFEGAQIDFRTSPACGWGVAETHGAWTTFDGLKHLDNQSPPVEEPQDEYCAIMKDRIPIPAEPEAPVLTFWYKADLNPADQVEVNIHYFDSTGQGGLVLKTDKVKVFSSQDNTGDFHAWMSIPLDSYKNKEIRVSFDQVPKQKMADTVFTVDEFRIGLLPTGDKDNDGIPDALDPTPNGEQIRAVPELRAQTGKELSVELSWSSLQEEPLLLGYRLYRLKQGQTEEVLLNNGQLLARDATAFTDTQVQNATGYTYRLAAVSKEGREGKSAVVFLYVAHDLLPFPYEESFDSAAPEITIPSNADWTVSRNHGFWTSFSGLRHLDSNPREEVLLFKGAGQKQIQAMMKKWVHIPQDTPKPVLSFWYKADLQLWLDWIYVDIHYIQHPEQGPQKELIDRNVRVYKAKNNTSQYVWESIPLDKYKGTEIRVAFRERSWGGVGASVFVLDDFRISQPSNNDANQNGIPDEYETPLNQNMLTFVEEFQAQADENGEVTLGWKPLEGIIELAGYNIYRRTFGSAEPGQKINPQLIGPQIATYTDASGENGTAYTYYIVAVSQAGVEGYPSLPANAFVAFNRAPVDHLSATWDKGQARLVWDQVAGLRYKIDRRTDEAEWKEIAQVEGPPFIDPDTQYVFNYDYRAATLKEFINPLSGVSVLRTGPLSESVSLKALPVPQIEISKAQLRPDGVYVRKVGLETPYAIEGTYKALTGNVTVQAVQNGLEANGAGSNGRFTIVLPAVGLWQILAKEADGWMSGTTALELILDDKGPSLQVDGAGERTTSDTLVQISGVAEDIDSGLAGVVVASNQYPGQSFGTVLSASGAFNGQVPLRPGLNLLTVTALDKAGNKTEVQIKVTLSVVALPVIMIQSPVNGAVVKDNRITVSGWVRSTLPANKIRLLLNDQLRFPSGSSPEYDFSFPDVKLAEGLNTLEVRAETPYGTVTAKVTVEYRLKEPDVEQKPPTIELSNSGPDIYLNEDHILIKGTAESLAGIKSITINGQTVDFSKIGEKFSFESLLNIPTSGEGVYKIVIVVTDMNGKSSTITLNVYYDASAPRLVLVKPVLSAETLNQVDENPLNLEGFVQDRYLAGLSLNEKPVGLIPNGEQDSYAFALAVPLTLGQEKNLVLQAWDLSGNRTTKEYKVTLKSSAAIEIISPRNGTEVMLSSQDSKIEVTARVTGVPAGSSVEAVVDNGSAQALPFSSGVANGRIDSPVSDGSHRLNLFVRTSSGNLMGQSSIEYKVVNADLITLALVRQDPTNGSRDVEPNEPINFYFNKPIEADKLTIVVKETAHGMIYDLSSQKNADIMSMSNIQMTEVNRDLEAVPGGVSLLPDKRTAAFYPTRDFAYNGRILVELLYGGKEIGRSQFEIRPLPTFIVGSVADQTGVGIGNVEVYLKGAGLKVLTSEDGVFNFGFSEPASRMVPPGRYEMVLNSGLKNRSYGTLSFWINVEEGRLNRLGMFRIPFLNPREPYRRISGGQAEVLLAAGDLQLDLSAASLLFPDGKSSGDVHAQFQLLQEVPYNTWPGAIPHWVFAVQPSGIEVQGSVGLSFRLPALYGSYDYIPKNETPVVLIGFDTHTKAILPVGVGRIRDGKVVSAGKVAVTCLDYLGFAYVDEKKQPVLEDFAAGLTNLQQMMQKLEE